MADDALLRALAALREAIGAVETALGGGAPMMLECDILEVPEAARLARKKPPTIRKLVAERCRGEVTDWIGYKVGGRVYLSRSRFLAYLAGGARG